MRWNNDSDPTGAEVRKNPIIKKVFLQYWYDQIIIWCIIATYIYIWCRYFYIFQLKFRFVYHQIQIIEKWKTYYIKKMLFSCRGLLSSIWYFASNRQHAIDLFIHFRFSSFPCLAIREQLSEKNLQTNCCWMSALTSNHRSGRRSTLLDITFQK